MTGAPLSLYNSLTRTRETFAPIDRAATRVYTCGPTVYNDQHVGNMRAFLFADTLGRVIAWKAGAMGWGPLNHIINITDVGHLTSDADAGDDKMERAAAEQARSIWDVAAHYTQAFKNDVTRLNIREPAHWTVATDYVPQMIAFAESIAERHCYLLDDGLYFDVSTVPDYGALARHATEAGEARIDAVAGKRQPQDFAIWRRTAPGEQRQMEWDSPWGRGAPGWHLECSVMSLAKLGHPFDIHTGGIDHREIHHPNEIAQNQAYCACTGAEPGFTGARLWMHNNFLVDRGAKMSKSSGGFLTLQRLVDRGFHPLAYRMMCLQAHYRSELEFSWDNLAAAATRLKRTVQAIEGLRARAGQSKGDAARYRDDLDAAVSDDLNTAKALTVLDAMLADKKLGADERLAALADLDAVLGLDLTRLTRLDLRVRPITATLDDGVVETRLTERRAARAAKDFATSDAIRDELLAGGVEVMDGDPLGWDWRV